MKYFTFILFLFSVVILNAQMSMEEISYIPSPSGYYNNLVVKGDVNIKEISTYPFNVHSYASFLDLEISTDTAKIYISNLRVSTGTVALFSEFDINTVNNWSIHEPNPERSEPPQAANIYMSGGSLSLAQSTNSSASLNIGSITFGDAIVGKSPRLYVKTQDFQYNGAIIETDFIVDNVYIMGMKIPSCPHKYYWQNVPVTGISDPFSVLACNTTTCSIAQQQGEEACLSKNTNGQNRYQWNTQSHPCECVDSWNSSSVVPVNPIVVN